VVATSTPALVLRIGRALLAGMTADGLAEHTIEIVNQLNRGALLISAQDERERLADLNLLAGRRATTSTAYASALTHLAAGAPLLPEGSSQRPARVRLRAGTEPGDEGAGSSGQLGDLCVVQKERRIPNWALRGMYIVPRCRVGCP
jgi:hypothetical protein